jgi:hypothetical protein
VTCQSSARKPALRSPSGSSGQNAGGVPVPGTGSIIRRSKPGFNCRNSCMVEFASSIRPSIPSAAAICTNSQIEIRWSTFSMATGASSGQSLGGQVSIDGGEKQSFESKNRIGIPLAVPLGPRYGLKLAGTAGAASTAGNDYDSVAASCQATS